MKAIVSFFTQIVVLAEFLARAVRAYPGKFSKDFVFKGVREGTVHVLGNGPCLPDSLHLIGEADDVVMVNFAVLSDEFFRLRPGFLCLLDTAFFHDTNVAGLEEKKARMIRALEKVDWELALVLPSTNRGSNALAVSNPKISLLYANNISLDFRVKYLRFWLFRRNFSLPSLANVVALGIYCSLQRGYKTVVLHGLDSDAYRRIGVNSKNEMVVEEEHFYGREVRNMNQEGVNGHVIGTLYKRLEWEVKTFRSYVDLSIYAKHLGIGVINASPRSMIDAFERYDHLNPDRRA